MIADIISNGTGKCSKHLHLCLLQDHQREKGQVSDGVLLLDKQQTIEPFHPLSTQTATLD